MTNREDQYVAAYNGFKVLRLPYRQGHGDTNREFSMYFYLPNQKNGLDDLMKKMTSTPGFVDNHIPSYQWEVGKFIIPKFKISFGFEASRDFNVRDTIMIRSRIRLFSPCRKYHELVS